MIHHGREVTAMGAPSSAHTVLSALRKERDECGAQFVLFL